jgi:uncharacterized NAD(P)/FAD-binding protein YdhS
MSDQSLRIAIIGGGFTGAMILVNVVHAAQTPLHIDWYEASGDFGLGVAYGTQNMQHRLNVPAGLMGAFEGSPDHFWNWLGSAEGKRQVDTFWPGRDITAETFVPRFIYGLYLRQIVREALALASQKHIMIKQHREEVESLEAVPADIHVLALGNEQASKFKVPNAENFIENVWSHLDDSKFQKRVLALPLDSRIVILGAGLTMVDTVLALQSMGFKGEIIAFSRNGLLPQPHSTFKSYPTWSWTQDPGMAPKTIVQILTQLRVEIRKAQKQGFEWQKRGGFLASGHAKALVQFARNAEKKIYETAFDVLECSSSPHVPRNS